MNNRLIGSIALVAFLVTTRSAGDEPRADSLSWFEGHWCAESDGEWVHEFWTTDRGGMRLGLSRTLRGERTTAFEFLRIVIENGMPVYIAQPNGGTPVRFTRSASGPGSITFENRAHDFPQRVEYRIAGKDRLRATIAGPGDDGKELVITYDYHACRVGS
jgi:hypothetical protein